MPSLQQLLGWRRFTAPVNRFRHWILCGVQLAIFLAAGIAAFLLRFDFTVPPVQRAHLLVGLAVWSISKLIVFHWLKLDRGWWRYASLPDLIRLVTGNLAGSAVSAVALLIAPPSGFPRSIYVIDLVLCFLFTGGIRLAVRMLFEFSRSSNSGVHRRTLIYGAGDAGLSLLREIRQNPGLEYDVIGFIDDSPAKVGSLMQRSKVLGTGAQLPAIVGAERIELILIALPSATGAEMTAIIRHCQRAGVAYKTIPGLAEVIRSSGLASQIRDVAVEDLLGRNPIHLDRSGIQEKIAGKAVIVTGAAGSIGSELCRQVAACGPSALVALDMAETPLFHIERELRFSYPGVTIYPEIASIQNFQRLREIFARYRPVVVYHAAAYKHVPMMEANAFEAIENNVIGTYNVAIAAAEFGAGDFVMISSDKAVRPTNIMGATKRAAELVIRSLQNGGPRYVSVRFGNVLGSNGSVVPIFKQQIAAGGPVTVTHPHMRRYFMTIPEAVQLVIQASTMGRGGEIFVLEMGKPVNIADLARHLIALSGLKPDEDIRIQFTGLRPGEKLYEELHTMDEEVLATGHEKIKIFEGHCPSEDTMAAHLARLRRACELRDFKTLVFTLKEIEPEYNPSREILALACEGGLSRLAAAVQRPEAQVAVPSSLVLASGD